MSKNVSNISEMAAKYASQIIELPGWEPKDPFVCRVKRPSIYVLATRDAIPNPLIDTIRGLFFGESSKKDAKPSDTKREGEAMLWIAEKTLQEPTLAEIEDSGLSLTDAQLAAIYTFAVGGAALLKPFLGKQGGGTDEYVGTVPNKAQPAIRDR